MRDKMKCWHYRIKDDRMENGIKGIRIWHCAFAACKYILCSTPTRSNAGADLNFFVTTIIWTKNRLKIFPH